MDQNRAVIDKFYQAFQQRDWKIMQACYHPEVTFSDPAFPDLNYQEVKAMWHMLCENAQDFSLEYSDIRQTGNKATCRWEARYTFSRSGRKVHNLIQAQVEFKDGLIARHHDVFNFWRWSQMALGFSGLLLGWSSFLKRKVQSMARKSLLKFMSEHPQYLI